MVHGAGLAITWSAAGLACGTAVGILATRSAVRRTERRHPPHGRIVTVDGSRVHVAVTEAATADETARVLLVHGAFGTARDWLLVADRLATRGIASLAIDRPGHGYSERAPDTDTPVGQAAWLRRALAALGEGPLDTVVGFSLGGAVALALALEHPDAARSLALVNPATHPWGTGHDRAYDVLGWPMLGRVLSEAGAMFVARRTAERAVARGFAPGPVAAGYVESGVVALATRPAALRANAADIRRLDAALAAMAPRYATLGIPIEVLAATDDHVVGPHIHARPLAATTREANLVELPGLGHQLPWSAPDAVVAAIERALGRRTTDHGDGAVTP